MCGHGGLETKVEGADPANYVLWICIEGRKRYGIMSDDGYVNIETDLVQLLLDSLVQCWSMNAAMDDKCVFLPSSRTGFILSRDLLTDKVYEASFNRVIKTEEVDKRETYFTKPIISFLQLLNRIEQKDVSENELDEIAGFIEKNILDGQIEIKKSIGKSMVYRPNGMGDEMQMYLTSAVVTEIAPLYLLCKYNYPMQQLFIEEPEMCMHPKFQNLVARVLIRILNHGVPVTLTTHSDIIIQHINNMIRLGLSDNKERISEKYNLGEKDILKLEDVAIYQFTSKEIHKSVVTVLHAEEDGFAASTFSNAYEKMLEETYSIQEV